MTREEASDSEDKSRLFDQWQDRAAWLAMLLLPLASLAFRRGWLLVLPLVCTLLPSPSVHAFEWKDLWLTRDQQGARALAAEDPGTAAQLFESPEWRGTAAYAAGDFAGAAQSFAAGQTPTANYNRGNALARAGRLQDALAAYDAALADDPTLEDAIANRRLVEDLLRQKQQEQEQQQKQQQQQQQKQQDSGQQSGDGQDEQQEQQNPPEQSTGDQGEPQQDGEENNQSQASGQEPESAPSPPDKPDAQTDRSDAASGQEPQQRSAASAQPADKPDDKAAALARETPVDEADQALEQWLRQVPDDPGALLRRKFAYEYQRKHAANPDQENAR